MPSAFPTKTPRVNCRGQPARSRLENRSSQAEGRNNSENRTPKPRPAGSGSASSPLKEPALHQAPRAGKAPATGLIFGIRSCAGEAGGHAGGGRTAEPESTTPDEPSGGNESASHLMSLEIENREPSRYLKGAGCRAPLSNSRAVTQSLGGVSEGDRTGRADRVSRENSRGESVTPPAGQSGHTTAPARAAQEHRERKENGFSSLARPPLGCAGPARHARQDQGFLGFLRSLWRPLQLPD
jgi:hypothetical protein